jgi:hypothetical protein
MRQMGGQMFAEENIFFFILWKNDISNLFGEESFAFFNQHNNTAN